MSKPTRKQPYINLDGTHGTVEGEIYDWYKKQKNSNTEMKKCLAVGYAISKINPVLFSMLDTLAKDDKLTEELFKTFVTNVPSMTAPTPSGWPSDIAASNSTTPKPEPTIEPEEDNGLSNFG